MAHKHSIYDSDLHFIINPITRKMTSESGKVTLMQLDHNSERFTFELPRYIEGHDMSTTDKVEVHYINIDSNKRQESTAIYEVTDLQISPESNDVIICSWLISQNATKYAGSLNFALRFVCYSDDYIEYQWSTEAFTGIKVVGGINNTEVLATQLNKDLIECWKEEIIQTFRESAEYKETLNAHQEVLNRVQWLVDAIHCNTRGEYDPTATYVMLDVVSHGNILWVCRESNITGIEPTKANSTYWQLAVELVPITEYQIDLLDPIVSDVVPTSAISIEELDAMLT